MTIQYRKRRKYRYTLADRYRIETHILSACQPDRQRHSVGGLLTITGTGLLTIHAGYAWDGPSWPAIDTKNFMRPSLIHDALYQLMREGVLPLSARKAADELLRKHCLEDGMSRPRAWWVYQGVRRGGESSARPNVLEAP